MKKYNKITMTIILSMLIAMPVVVLAQDNLEEKAEDISERMDQWGEKMEAWGQDLEQALENGDIPTPPSLPFGKNADDDYGARPRLGAYIDDMDFVDAYEKHYPYCYGVYISSVVRGGNSELAGIREGDIVMEFDGEKVRFEDHLLQLRDSRNIGDTVTLKLFRNEEEFETLLTFSAPKPKEGKEGKKVIHISGMKKERKLHPGYGGGGPEVILLDADFVGINTILLANGFDEIDDNYMPLFGGYGMGNVGNGWFIGGGGYGYEKIQKISIDSGTRRYEYTVGFGGVTINKKIALAKDIVVDLGVLIGGGSTSFELRQTDGDYTWTDSFDDNPSYYSLKYRKKFFAYRPSAGVLIRVLPWMGIHGSVGYLGSYSFNDDWVDDYFGYTVKGDSPKILDGLSYSLGVWFGH
ncbi:MAG: PDZ domain-containing protein [Candidatus Neomarinimicrobiota bacterium]